MKRKISHVNHPNKEENENRLMKETDPPSTLDSRFSQTLRNVQGSKKRDADGKKMECKTNSSDLSCNSSQTQIPFLIMWSCLFIAWLLFSLPREQHKNENRVPALMLFTAHPSLFLVLVIAVMLSFAGASGSLLLIGNMAPRVATIRRCYSILSFVSISSALSILAFALFLETFRQNKQDTEVNPQAAATHPSAIRNRAAVSAHWYILRWNCPNWNKILWH